MNTFSNDFLVGSDEIILVTGANGFVGSKVVAALLSQGFKQVRCLTRSASKAGNLEILAQGAEGRIHILKGNLLDRDLCSQATENVSLIYHLAAGVGKSFADCFLNSVVTTRNLLEAAIKAQGVKRFVNVSSIAVYSNDSIKHGGLFDETCPLDDKFVERHEPYTYGKAKQDELVLDYGRKHDVPYVIVRPGVVFGPGKAKITDRIGTDTFGVFLHLGLSNRIPLTYVDNCAEAIILAGLKNGIEGQVFNIVDDDLPKSRDFLKLYKQRVRRFFSIPVPHWIWFSFCALWEKYSAWSQGQLPPVFNRRAYSVYWKDHEYSNRKAKELLNWQPRVPMSKALDIFFTYLKEKEHLK